MSDYIERALRHIGEIAPILAAKVYADHVAIVTSDHRKFIVQIADLPVETQNLASPEEVTRATVTPPDTAPANALREQLIAAIGLRRVELIDLHMAPPEHLFDAYPDRGPGWLHEKLIAIPGIGPATADKVIALLVNSPLPESGEGLGVRAHG